LKAFNEIAGAYSPEGVDRFAKEYGAVNLNQDADGAFRRSDDTQDFWFVPTSGTQYEGLILPGRETVRTWERFFRALSGERARRMLGPIYELAPGPALMVIAPAAAQATDRGYLVTHKGRLQGI
jgi:hypothetical protein